MNKKIKIVLVVMAAVAALALAPVAIKAATDGEVDIYADLLEMLAVLSGRVSSLEAEVAELKAEKAEREAAEEEPEEPPADPQEPEEQGGGSEGGSPPVDGDPPPDGDPPAEPEPQVNPYAHLNIDHLQICTIDGVPHFGIYRIEADFPAPSSHRYYPVRDDGAVICFTERDKDRTVAWLIGDELEYTIKPIHVDPLIYEIIKGKKFYDHGPEEARLYINKVIAGEIKP